MHSLEECSVLGPLYYLQSLILGPLRGGIGCRRVSVAARTRISALVSSDTTLIQKEFGRPGHAHPPCAPIFGFSRVLGGKNPEKGKAQAPGALPENPTTTQALALRVQSFMTG